LAGTGFIICKWYLSFPNTGVCGFSPAALTTTFHCLPALEKSGSESLTVSSLLDLTKTPVKINEIKHIVPVMRSAL
jgi:hypothetical protein